MLATDFSAAVVGDQVVPPTDSAVIGVAHFTLNDAETELTYRIELSGLDLKQNPADRTAPNDVTKVHIHWGDRGTNGPHVLNVFGLPSEDDSDLTIDFDTEVIVGTWDDGDVVGTPPLGDGETKPLTDFVDELKTGELYVQVHTVQFDEPGAIRGQIQMGSVEVPRSIHLEGTGSSERDFSLPGQVLVGPAVVEIDGQPFDMISFATVLQSRLLPDSTIFGRVTHTFEFGDGSTLTTLDHSRLVPTEAPGVNQFRPSRVITGGTGIFEGAAGRLGTIAGEDNFINLFSQSAVWSLRGAIAVPPLVAGVANGDLGPRPADGTTFTVTSTADSGPGSLRNAIIDANASTGLDTLVFDIGAGLHVISPLSPLPEITDPITIDAMPQVAQDGSPRVVLDGSNAGPDAAGLYISAGYSTVRGLAVGNFDADGIVLSSHGANVLEGNYIGVDANGSLPMSNGRSGVFIMNSVANRIGGISPQQRNIISANHGAGIEMLGGGAAGNLVMGNYIGTDARGAFDLGNAYDGVIIANAPGNTIGGLDPRARNLISGNDASGVAIIGAMSAGNLVQGNAIGTDALRKSDIGNSLDGVAIVDAPGNTVGGTQFGNFGENLARNLISGNNAYGVSILGVQASGNTVQGNYIGTDDLGLHDLGNGFDGILIDRAPGNQIGGTALNLFFQNVGRNLISGNDAMGITMLGDTAAGNVVEGNFIGTDVTGGTPLGNRFDGVVINGAPGNVIGGTMQGGFGNNLSINVISGNGNDGIALYDGAAGNMLQGNYVGVDADAMFGLGNNRHGVFVSDAPGNHFGGTSFAAANVISGNDELGVYIVGGDASGNVLEGNFIGTDAFGASAIPNAANGILLDRASGNTIGGSAVGARNVISGNGRNGIELISGSVGNTVQGNYIGVDVTGSTALSNATDGLVIAGSGGNTVGGAEPLSGNIISGNGGNGVIISFGASGNVFFGNRIGADITGTTAIGNASNGVLIANAAANIIGGPAFPLKNVISGNGSSGILLFGPFATANTIQGNLIGTDITASADLGNGAQGVQFNNAPGNTLGGTAIGAGNVISGNDATGVLLFGGATTANVLQGNLIGTKGDGLTPLGNTSHGILVSAAAANNFIGSGGIGNTIAHNQAHGVAAAFPSRTVIRTNSIFDNAGLGIDLHINGVTPNDLTESDAAQNFPVITSVTANRVEGTLNSRPHATFVVELFASDETDPSGHGEGTEFLGADIITTDANGSADFAVAIRPLAEGMRIAATATDIVANATSEFSVSMNSSSHTNEDIVEYSVGSPVLTSATVHEADALAVGVLEGLGFITVQGDFRGDPNTEYRLEFFANSQTDDPSGSAGVLLGIQPITTDDAGNAKIYATFPPVAPVGHIVMATATAPDGITSALSAPVTMVPLRVPNIGLRPFFIPTPVSQATTVITGPDGNVYFTEQLANQIGRLNIALINDADPSNDISEFPIPTSLPPNPSNPFGSTRPIAQAFDLNGNLWFAELFGNAIGMFDLTTETITEFPLPNPASQPGGMTLGPDGNIWFNENSSNRIGRFDPDAIDPTNTAAAIAYFAIPTSIPPTPPFPAGDNPTGSSQPRFIRPGPDGNIWFTEFGANKIGRVNLDLLEDGDPTNDFSEFVLPFDADVTPHADAELVGKPGVPTSNILGSSQPRGLASGADGNMWFTEFATNKIGRLNLALLDDGDPSNDFTEFEIPTPDSVPFGIVAGPDGNLWFTEHAAGKIGIISTQGEFLAEIPLPSTAGPSDIQPGPNGTMIIAAGAANLLLLLENPDADAPQLPSQPVSILPPSERTGVTVFSAGFTGHVGGLTLDPAGENFFFSEQFDNRIGRFNIATQQVTEWTVPPGLLPHSAKVGPSIRGPINPRGAIWWSGLGAGFAVFDLTTERIDILGFGSGGLPTPGSELHDYVFTPDGHMYFTEQGASVIGRLNLIRNAPNFLQFEEFPIEIAPGLDTSFLEDNESGDHDGNGHDEGFRPHNIIISPPEMFGPNKLLVALEDDDALAVWDTKTRLITTVFDVDLDGGVPDRAPHDMHIAPGPDGELHIYYTQLTGHRLGRLNAQTGEVVEFPTLAPPALPGSSTDFVMGVLPNAPSMFHLIHHEETNSIWFALQQQARVGRFDIATETITEYSLGIPPGRGPLVLHEGPDGAIWASTVSLVPTVPGGLIRIDPERAEAAIHPVVVGADPGEEPRVRVFDSVTGQEWLSFLAFDPTFDGGVTVTLEDVTMNGTPEIIATSDGITRVFDLATGVAHTDPEPSPVQFFGPSPYLSVDDTPDGFLSLLCDQCARLEDFEDGALSFGLRISTGMVIAPDFGSGLSNLTDSVDADDGVIDGTGQTGDGGYSWFAGGNSVLITLPGIVQSAGVVWTDGDTRLTDVIFEALDQDGRSLGQINAGDIADDSIQGTTDEDRFFGIRFGDGMLTGVTAIRISNVGPSGIEIDHIQFANCAVCGDAAQGLATTTPMDGDIDLDGQVSFTDFVILADNFGIQDAAWTDGDLNGDGTVDFSDIVVLANNFGQAASSSPPVAPPNAAAADIVHAQEPLDTADSFWSDDELLDGLRS